jgi:hypothetical protein
MRVLVTLAALAALTGVAATLAARRDPPHPPPRVFAFVSHRGGAELRRLERVGARIDVVAPNWYALAPATGLLRAPSGRHTGELLKLAAARGVRVWPVVNARTGGSGAWTPAPARARIVASLRAAALGPGAQGVTLDMEELTPTQRPAFTALVREAAAALRRVDRRLAVYVPRTARAYDWRALADAADLLLAAGYNESYAGSRPGPITTPRGFDAVVERSLRSAGRRKAVPLLGAFGYRWPRHGRGELIATDDALALRRRTRAHTRHADGHERFRAGSATVIYQTAAGLRARWRDARAAGAGWVGLFTLGSEPAHFWDGLETRRGAHNSDASRPASAR